MPIVSWLAIYFVVWWLCLLVVLPMGARSQREAGEVIAGSEPGAPALVRLWPRLLITSVLALVVCALVMLAIGTPIVQRYLAVNR